MTKKRTYQVEGWASFCVKQYFDVEAQSQQEANQKIWQQHRDYALYPQWLDYNTNKIKGDVDVSFFDEEGNKIEEPA